MDNSKEVWRDDDRKGPFERYLSILEIVAAAHDGLTMTDIAKITDLPKPTVHRLTRVLLDSGALVAETQRQRRFRIGPRLWRVLYLGFDRDAVTAYAQMACDAAASRLKETCYIVRLGQTDVRTVARATPDQGYRLHVNPGSDLPAHAAASAKAIIAFQPQKAVTRYIREPLPRLTQFTKTDISAYLAELEETRTRGYAICDREIDENVMAYAVPVQLPDAGVLFSVGVTGPCSRFLQNPPEFYISGITEAAGQFARALESVQR